MSLCYYYTSTNNLMIILAIVDIYSWLMSWHFLSHHLHNMDIWICHVLARMIGGHLKPYWGHLTSWLCLGIEWPRWGLNCTKRPKKNIVRPNTGLYDCYHNAAFEALNGFKWQVDERTTNSGMTGARLPSCRTDFLSVERSFIDNTDRLRRDSWF